MDIPTAVKTLRELHGETQPAFAARVKIPFSFLSKLENGVAPAPLDALGNLAWCCLKIGNEELLDVFRAQMRQVLQDMSPGSTRPQQHTA